MSGSHIFQTSFSSYVGTRAQHNEGGEPRLLNVSFPGRRSIHGDVLSGESATGKMKMPF